MKMKMKMRVSTGNYCPFRSRPMGLVLTGLGLLQAAHGAGVVVDFAVRLDVFRVSDDDGWRQEAFVTGFE